MSKYPSFSRYESGAASGRIRDELASLRHHMRSEAILGEATARPATQMNLRPGVAEDDVCGMAAQVL
ncbi:hypothetical protein ACQEVF_29790 [Nonomuraea polychroma]|uniref:hypothetical protein n=1 Tax=Nonomuraea polychroma TaxID=46176 RepID=UPI003D8E2723